MGVSLELLQVKRPRYIGSALYQNHMHRYWWYWLKSPSRIIRPFMGGISMRKSRFSKFQALVGKTSFFVAKPQVPGIPCSNMQSCAQRNCMACPWHFVELTCYTKTTTYCEWMKTIIYIVYCKPGIHYILNQDFLINITHLYINCTCDIRH